MKKIIFLFILLIAGVGAVSAGVLQPVEILPDNPWSERAKVVLKFDVPVHVLNNARITVSEEYLGSTTIKPITGRLVLSPDDPTGKTVEGRFKQSNKDIELDSFEWEQGYRYTFTVSANQIYEKGNSDLRNEQIEWMVINQAPVPDFTYEGQSLPSIDMEQVSFEWRGAENAMDIDPSSKGNIQLTVYPVIPIGGGLGRGMSRHATYPLVYEADEENHVYRCKVKSIPEKNPNPMMLIKDCYYLMSISGLISRRAPHKLSSESLNPRVIGTLPMDSECFPQIEVVDTRMFVNSGYGKETIGGINVYFNQRICESFMFTPHIIKLYADGELWYECDYRASLDNDRGSGILRCSFYKAFYDPEKKYELYIPLGIICSGADQQISYWPYDMVEISKPSGIESNLADAAERELPVYDLYGRKVEKPVPGNIYIRGGKKFVMRQDNAPD